MNCKCGGEYILDGSWYVCQECGGVVGDFSHLEDDAGTEMFGDDADLLDEDAGDK